MVELSELNLFDAPAYAGLTLPEFRAALAALDGREILAIGATDDGRPIGLVFARSIEPFVLQAQSLFVAKSHRGRGLARQLLEALEIAAIRAGHRRIDLQYRRLGPTLDAWERVLARRGYQPLIDGALHSYWFRSQLLEWKHLDEARLDDGYQIVPWGDVGADARAELARSGAEDRWFPEHLDPIRHEAGFEPLNSVALRFEGRIVGWHLTHRIDATCLDYTNIFVHSHHNLMKDGSFASMALWAEGIRRQRAADGPGCTGRFDVSETNKSALLIVANYFGPYLIEAVESRRVYKVIQSAIGNG